MKNTIIACIILFASAFTLGSCKKDSSSSTPTPNPVNRDVKYEITGNYTGRFTVVYADKDGSYETIEVTSLPWTLSFTADPATPAAGFGVGGVASHPGVKGQTAAAKIYINNAVVKTSNGTANDEGHIITMNPGTHSF